MYTLDQILVSLKRYLDCKLDSETKDYHVVLDSVKKDKETAKGDLVITLLRIEEETSRKPQNFYHKLDKDVQLLTSPDLDINLEILISAPTLEYETALTLIANVISILNSIKTVAKPDKLDDEDFERIDSMNISMMGMSFDQMLSMWQTLGGTVVPAVAYKIRMITVPGLDKTGELHLVDEGKVQIETGRMDAKGKVAESLTAAEKEKLSEAQKRKEKQREHMRKMAELDQKKEEEKESDESKRSIQIREK